MTVTKIRVLKYFVVLASLAIVSCDEPEVEIVLPKEFMCNLLFKMEVDMRLDHVPSPKQFASGDSIFRLKSRPSDIPPLRVYISNQLISPENDEILMKSWHNLKTTQTTNEKKILTFPNAVCEDFQFIELASITLDRNKDRHFFSVPSRGVIVQMSKMYLKKPKNNGAFFIIVTKGFLDNTKRYLIETERKQKEWEVSAIKLLHNKDLVSS